MVKSVRCLICHLIRVLKVYKIRYLKTLKGLNLRLLKQISRQVGDNEYVKWLIIIPPSDVEKLDWKEGQELESQIKGRTLVIKLRTKPKQKPEKMSYTQFRDKIKDILVDEPEGLTWTDIKEKLKLPQKVPNNLWVRMMERDIGLIRELDHKIAKKVWRLRTSKLNESLDNVRR